MAIVTIKDRVFHSEPHWDEYIESTDFTSDIHPMLYRYYIDDIEVTKETFEKECEIDIINYLFVPNP